MSERFPRLPFVACATLLGGGLLLYSQTLAISWDEGFHLEAAQLIESGKKPYLDFVLAQTPLNAYWNSFWLRLFHNSWHAVHAVAALLTTAAVVLAADFLRTRFRVPGWKLASVLAVLFLTGGNQMVAQFGVIGQAYGLALFLTVAAFRSGVLAVERGSVLLAGLTGFLAAAAAGSTLLTAPVAPVLLLWILYYRPSGSKRSRMAFLTVFAGGAFIALLPVIVLFLKSPLVVTFDIFKYHMFYRRSDWPGATRHDLEVFTSWLEFPQSLILGTLTAAGVWFVAKKSDWDRQRRGEFYLCGFLALAVGLFVSTAHPTFPQYYLFTVPFLSILSSVGLFAIASQMGAQRAFWPVAGVCGLFLLGLGRMIYDDREQTSWKDIAKIAAQVAQVTPAGAPFLGDEQVYFLLRRTPPSGNEYTSSHSLRLPATLAAAVKIVPQPEVDRQIAAGMFATVETCEDDDWRKERKLPTLYKQKAEIGDCAVFWEWAKK
jgi:hypothetical protein